MSNARENVEKLRSIVSVTQYGARGDGVTDNTVAIQAAIDAASAAGGGNVWIPEGTYCVSSSIALKSHVRLMGDGDSSVLYATGSSSIKVLDATTAVTFAPTLSLAFNAAQNAVALILSDASTISTGDVLLLSVTNASHSPATKYTWMTLVTAKVSNTLTIADPLPHAIATTDTYEIRRLATPGVENVGISNLRIKRGTNSGADTYGVAIYGGLNLDLDRLTLEDFGSSNRGGIVLYYCLHGWISNIFTERCGSIAVAAQNYTSNTGLCFENLRSYDDDGFGLLFSTCAYTQAAQISCVRSGDAVNGRGIKISSDLRGQYHQAISTNSAYTGVMLSTGCVETQVSNLVLISNGWSVGNDGLNIADYAKDVRVSNVLAHGNSLVDINIATTATNTYIDGITASGTVQDLGTASTLLRAGFTRFANTWHAIQTFRNATYAYTTISDVAATNGQTGLQITVNNSGGVARTSYLYSAGNDIYLQSPYDIAFKPGASTKGIFYADGSVVFGSATGGPQGVGTLNAQAVYDDGVLLTCYVLEAWLDGAVNVDFWDGLVPDRHIPAVITGQETGNPVEVEPARVETRRHERARGFASVANDRLDIDNFAQFLRTNKRLPAFPGPEQWQDLYAGKMATGDLLQRIWETCEVLAVHLVEARDREVALEARITALENANAP